MDLVIFTGVTGPFFQRSIGAYQIAHFLRGHGFTVQVVDFTDHFTVSELTRAIDKFVDASTLAIGVSSTFYTGNDSNFISMHGDRYSFDAFPSNIAEAIKYAKSKFAQLKIVVGGAKSHAASQIDIVDAVIHGYAEDKMLAYMNSLRNPQPKPKAKAISIKRAEELKVISENPLENLFDIQTLDHRFSAQDIILPAETLPIEISRGCIFKCNFCAFPLNGKAKFDYLRDPVLIKEELAYNYEMFGTTNYFLCDDTLNDSTLKIEGLHRAITSLPFKINFATYLRLDLLSAHREQISMLQEMGLASPFFGIESLNQKSASSIGKGMKSEKVKDFLLELYHDHWAEQIPLTCSFIIGLPHETEQTARATYEWIKDTELNSIFFPLTLTMKSFYKSEFQLNFSKYGYDLDVDTGQWSNGHFTTDSATELANEFNTKLAQKTNKPSSWFLMTLLNHGYSLEEAKSTKISDLNSNRILRNMQLNIRKYKTALLV